MRREKELVINDRGNELRFKIKEMSAIELDSWLTRRDLLFKRAGLDDNFLSGNERGESDNDSEQTSKGCLEFEEVWSLLNEMLACCRRVEAGIEQICTPGTVDGFIADVRTIQKLRMEALQLNLDFSEPEPVKGSGSREVFVMGRPQIKPSSLNR